MPLQNRVDPYGNILSSPARGLYMGNRGCLHNNKKVIVRAYKTKAWITCALTFKNNKRELMSPGKYTELFFLDEATSFSAGHRPCSLCRYNDYILFMKAWLSANQDQYKTNGTIKEIDDILHKERITISNKKNTYSDYLANLPDGTFIELNENSSEFYLVYNGSIYLWSHSGYLTKSPIINNQHVIVLTPKSIVNMFKQKYLPKVHNTIDLVSQDKNLSDNNVL